MKKQKPLLSLEPADQNAFEEKIQAFKSKQRAKSGLVPGVIFIGHIPHGFYEKEMEKYFSQFGKVMRVRLGRSRKTGGSKGFAFVEFECDEVAKIVADTMNNYLMFDKILKCEFIPPEKVQPGFFRGWRLGQPLAYAANRISQNKQKIRRIERCNWKRRLTKLERVKEKLSIIGVNFDLPIELPEKRKVHSTSQKILLPSVEKRMPLKKGTLLKGKNIVDEAVQVNTKNLSIDTVEGQADKRSSFVNRRSMEFYPADEMQTFSNTKLKSSSKSGDRKNQKDLETSVNSEKHNFGKKRKFFQRESITHFENDFAIQISNHEMSGTPGKFLLATANDVALAARKFITPDVKSDVSFRGRNDIKKNRKSQEMDVDVNSEKPSFTKKRKSTQATIVHCETDFTVQNSNDVQQKNFHSVKNGELQLQSPSRRFDCTTPERVTGTFMNADDTAGAAQGLNSSGKKKQKSRNNSLKIDDLSSVHPSFPFRPESNRSEIFEGSGKTRKGKKGRHGGVVKTSTPLSAAGISDTSADDSSRYTLEIDTSENEITVRTPPKAIKKLKSKNKWQKQKKPLSFGKSPSNFSVSEISQKSVKSRKSLNSGWKVSAK